MFYGQVVELFLSDVENGNTRVIEIKHFPYLDIGILYYIKITFENSSFASVYLVRIRICQTIKLRWADVKKVS